MLNNIKAIFFDLDGTLIDSEPIYNKFWLEAAKELGLPLSKEDALSLRSLDSTLAMERFQKWFNDGSLYLKVKQIRIKKMNEFIRTNPIKLKNNVEQTLDLLNKKNIALYVVTATKKDDAIALLNGLNILHYFKEVISTKDVKRGKPYSDVYLKALELAKLDCSSVIAVEDSPNGVKSALNAKLMTIYVPDLTNNDEELEGLNHLVINDIFEITKLVG